ncbi:hypothetical protein [Euzebya rosea]|uniref:hypothetical protein n=1 Tax=Euzebya rosea TaxID=2052804 RepID=UPI000D3E51EA|nr:hypothetical protein [Euzebya rosea]
MMAVRILVAGLGWWVVGAVVMSAMRTVVLPRGEPVRLTATLFASTRKVFDVLLRFRDSYESRDRLMARYGPLTLLLLPLVWLGLTWLGFAAILWAIEQCSVEQALVLSGSSLITLGFDKPDTLGGVLVSFFEGALSLSVLALLLVTYLPSMYAAFSERERHVSLLEVRASTPPTPVDMMIRYRRIRGLGTTDAMWQEWEEWFARVQESHTSLPALVFFRSPDPRLSWVTAAGAVLDSAAMLVSAVDLHAIVEESSDIRVDEDGDVGMPVAQLCIRAGFLALRAIGDQHGLRYDPESLPTDPISVTREEFEDALDRMAAGGVPLRDDRDAAWRDWSGWRVNYDAVLLQLAALTVAPPTPWVSDRDPVDVPPASGARGLPGALRSGTRAGGPR